MKTELDLLIIGAGPIGLACGIEAKNAGLNYLIVEKGCLVNSIYHYPVNMTFFSTSERLEIGNIPFVSNNPKPVRSEALEYYRRVADSFKLKVNLFEACSEIIPYASNSQRSYKVVTSKNEYVTKNIIIATGFYDLPYKLDVPGEDLPKVKHYYNDPHYYAFQNVLVVGAQNSAVDAALETWRKGANVTLVVRGPEIGKRVKYWVRPDVINRIEEGSIKAYFNSTIEAIRPHEADIKTPEGIITIPNDWVIAMTGYMPNLNFLRNAGIKLTDDEIMAPVLNETTYETNLPGIYLAGVICGGMNTHRLFIENSREHATAIIRDIIKK